MNSETRPVGRIVGAFGLRGQLKIEPLTDFLDRFDVGSKLLLRGKWHTIESSGLHKSRPLIKLSGVDDATTAESLQWEYLEATPHEHPELDEDEFMTQDLIGLKVVTVEGEDLGVVDDVLALPAQDVLQVGEILIPVVKAFVKDIDLDAERITVMLIPGMRPEP